MSLNRTKGNQILCATCTYDADDSCNFPKRPNATSCTLYQDMTQANNAINTSKKPLYPVPWWQQINQIWLALGILVSISIIIAIS